MSDVCLLSLGYIANICYYIRRECYMSLIIVVCEDNTLHYNSRTWVCIKNYTQAVQLLEAW